MMDSQIPFYRDKFSNLSEFLKELKQRFTRFYNKKHGKRGYFWGDRFKSVLVQNGDTLVNCLAYIDLNPVRAGLVEQPEDYRWSSIGYYVQTKNKEGLISTNFGLPECENRTTEEKFVEYREFLYEKGALDTMKGAQINNTIMEKERKKGFELTSVDRLRLRTRYFTDSGIIGTKGFVIQHYNEFKDYFNSTKPKKPKRISGLNGIYSLKKLSGEK